LKENWSESRVKAVLHQYRAIAEVLHDPGTVSGSDSQRETDDTLSYLLQLVIEKADIEQAILYLPWPRLVPAALYWIGGYYQGSIALLEGCRQSVISDALQQAQEEVVGWLVHGRYPSPPRYTGRRRGWDFAPVVVALLCSGTYGAQELGRWLTNWSLERCYRYQPIRTWLRDPYTRRGVTRGAPSMAANAAQ